ncbi:hypothetical protein CCACVL1_08443 [Corchorus capsularis]|uniref:Uncharacterized protein n=1 Tax=Corchorus capsularis TaxID=210143 RepID=A0A1R3J0K7_COCAP|nr:hypothetical protein CCACVL1_08443 [Corchorus capsularis]
MAKAEGMRSFTAHQFSSARSNMIILDYSLQQAEVLEQLQSKTNTHLQLA